MPQVPPIVFGSQVCGSLDPGGGGDREWLVPDGVGGYAMGTVAGLPTRRYHGLLVVAGGTHGAGSASAGTPAVAGGTHGAGSASAGAPAVAGGTPAGRRVGLVSLDPVLTLASGHRIPLGCREWRGGAVSPAGNALLECFGLLDGLPRWRWRVGDVVIERELAMAHGGPSLALVHRVRAAPEPVTLTLEALCTWRDAHGERTAAGAPLEVEPVADGAVVAGAYRLAGPNWRTTGGWYTGAYHRAEAARGLEPAEDLWYAGEFSATLRTGEAMEVSAWAGDLQERPRRATAVVTTARRRNRAVAAAATPADGVDAALALAADAFVVDRPGGPDVVAGYPWFGTWSRDTMTSYEGLFLETNRSAEGRRLLTAYGALVDGGMLPNTADTGRVEYNTVDAALWYLHAVDRHVHRTDDTDLAAELMPALDAIVAGYRAGTRFGIGVDPADGLVAAGDRRSASGGRAGTTAGPDTSTLTWMDACVGGFPVTPRTGKPVEVNALWINGLTALAGLKDRLGVDSADLYRAADTARGSFVTRFAGSGSPAADAAAVAGWLHDVVDCPEPPYPRAGAERTADPVLRPNQLLAFSLPHAPLKPDAQTVAAVGAQLLTPLGLRSLAAAEPGYRGRHAGGPEQRDEAYHQGTVWPWLIGPYVDTLVAAGASTAGLLAGLESHLPEYGLGSVSETADGDAPHRATGCPFQAWSVAEFFRVRRKIR